MASYTVAVGQFGAYEKALAADVADTVTFTGQDLTMVEVVNINGTAPIYATSNGVVPTDKDAAARWVIYPGQAVQFTPKSSAPTTIKLVSRAAATYSVADVS